MPIEEAIAQCQFSPKAAAGVVKEVKWFKRFFVFLSMYGIFGVYILCVNFVCNFVVHVCYIEKKC